MAKKNKLKPQSAQTTKAPAVATTPDAISPLGWKVIAAGAGAVITGFFVLSRVDSMGRNWAADVAPLLILGGYALIGLGIFADGEKGGGETPSSTPPFQP